VDARDFRLGRSFLRTRSLSPIVARVELAVNRKTALLYRCFEVSDGSHNVGVAHVPRRIIILVHGEDAGVPRVQVVKRLEVRGVLGDEGEAMCGRKGEMDVVILAGQSHSLIGGASYLVPWQAFTGRE
jgi:hypothetical protein